IAQIESASSSEFCETKNPIVGLMTEWLKGDVLEKRTQFSNLGGTMRLGAFVAELKENSHIAKIYGMTRICERHRHRYEVNIDYKDKLEQCGLILSGMSPDGILPETIEYADHPWFIGVQYHPLFIRRPLQMCIIVTWHSSLSTYWSLGWCIRT
ncbi:glutamine amidotransferase-related protein, partial [Bartonella bovis]|uniref:glutamine amidotransferase-related protein n=1 Tax=Bartonella bovis TaxID=155194 RepID=UPI003CCF3BAE